MEPDKFREGMARLGAAVNIVSTMGPAGRAALTATAVCSVTDGPPTLLVCVNRNSRSLAIMKANGAIAVNVLRRCHDDLAMRFSSNSLSQDDRFTSGDWTEGVTGAPLLADAMASFDCRIDASVDIGTHCVLYCLVEDVVLRQEKDGLFYFDRNFCELVHE